MSESEPVSKRPKHDPEAGKYSDPLKEVYPPLPTKKYDIIYADPPWDYGGQVQFDKSGIRAENLNLKRDTMYGTDYFRYPPLKLSELKSLDVKSIAADDCILFMWTTGPQLANAVELGKAWGFEYKTVAFVWDKRLHNPGRYTLSQTEFVLAFKKGRFPTPRGARNIRQLISVRRGEHSEKPEAVIDGITKMFPEQAKIELFARKNYYGWDNWGLNIPENKAEILSQGEIDTRDDENLPEQLTIL